MKHFLYKIIFTFLILFSNGFASDLSDPQPDQRTAATKLYIKTQVIPAAFGTQHFTGDQADKIVNIIYTAKTQGIPQDNNAVTVDFGYSFPHMSPSILSVLIPINQRVLSGAAAPIFYDFGSGYGQISLYVTFAGGRVFSIEQNVTVATQAQKRVYKALKDVAINETQKKAWWDNLTMFRGDALQLDSEKMYPKDRLIDVAYMGHFLHFLTPTQLPLFLSGLHKKMASGGTITALVHAPFGKAVDLFVDQKAAKSDFPGHMVFTQDSTRVAQAHEKPGHYYAVETTTPKNSDHMGGLAVHFFDADTLREVFEGSGYEVINCLYLNGNYQDVGNTLGADDFRKGEHVLWITAQKSNTND